MQPLHNGQKPVQQENGTVPVTDSTTKEPDTDEEQKEDLGLGVSRRRHPVPMQILHKQFDLLRPVAAVTLTGRNGIWKSF